VFWVRDMDAELDRVARAQTQQAGGATAQPQGLISEVRRALQTIRGTLSSASSQ